MVVGSGADRQRAGALQHALERTHHGTGDRLLVREGGGSIVLFSSIRSVTVEPGQSVYAATKARIVQLVRTLAAELRPEGVRVNAVAPGVTPH